MRRDRRSRTLSPEDLRLWTHVARHVTPLPGRRPILEDAEEQGLEIAAPAAAISAPNPPARLSDKRALPPLAPLERKLRVALRRGVRTVDAVLDLHGMRQSAAHDALVSFLRQSQAMERSIVLIVTGKGAPGTGAAAVPDERGVLRRVVPHWLRLPDLRPLVLGVTEAAPHHGGAGALYVRLRRRRAADHGRSRS